MKGFDGFFALPGQGATAPSQEAASATGGQKDEPVGARAAPHATPPTMREQVKAKKQCNQGQNYPKIYDESKNIDDNTATANSFPFLRKHDSHDVKMMKLLGSIRPWAHHD
jgi:hypothetical protein